jgi:hypothetical protein
MNKRTGSETESGSVIHRIRIRGDLDPYLNFTDPEHYVKYLESVITYLCILHSIP